MRREWYLLAVACVLATTIVVAACNGSSGSMSTGVSTVNVMLSDPATCQAPNGPYSHVYVTISDVQANVSSTASATGSGWIDLTPSLSSAPKQVDLLGQANNQCFLASLGDNMQLQAGNYQQIRLILASNSTSITNSACGNAANCVVLASDNSVHTLQLSSEAQTGIKIPSGQIAAGGFNITSGQTKDLDIDFDTCDSIVAQGNGQYRLKPVLHAGEVSTTSTSINGKILDKSTGNPVDGTVTVAVEQKDTSGVDRVFMSTDAASDGTFVFCPLPAGTYDVVVVGTRSDGVMYQPAIETGVSVGSTAGTLALSLPASTSTSSATLSGMVTSQSASSAGTAADVQLSALETVNSSVYTIPLPPTKTQSSDSLSVETATSTTMLTCPNGTDCVDYSMTLPSSGAYIGAWSSAGVSLTASATWASYQVDGNAFVPGSGGTADCNPTEVKSATTTFTAAGPYTANLSALGFVQCQ